MSKPHVLIHAWLPGGILPAWTRRFTEFEIIDATELSVLAERLPEAEIVYGLPALPLLSTAPKLRWIQLISAGVPRELGPVALKLQIKVTNLAGLYGPTIAEHAICLMTMVARNLHQALRNQLARKWDRTVARTVVDLHGKTLAIIGLGNIGQSIARLARAYGMQVFGCRRSDRPSPYVDRQFPLTGLREMLAAADFVAVAAPLTDETEGMLGEQEFCAMKSGAIYVNVSRGPIAQEKHLVAALESGKLAGAGMDVFAVEPLADGHPLWSMPQVVISPHYSGETVNQTALPSERFARNLNNWLAKRELEGLVRLDLGY